VSNSETQRQRQLFGTDGIRGIAGQYPLDRRTVQIVGQALGKRLTAEHNSPRTLIGQDTRESSEWIAEALALGLISEGAQVTEAGTITTPGIAYLARTRAFSAGVVISASHNPWQDNGIKVFGHDGLKLSDEVEHQIEAEIFRRLEALGPTEVGPANQQLSSAQARDAQEKALTGLPPDPAMHAAYVEWLVQQVGSGSLNGLRAIIDCANGATAALAPEVFRACGVEAEFMNVQPNGRNINQGCGALHPECVAARVGEANAGSRRYDLGVTFDGDGDRALFSDERGNVFNGDAVLLIAARAMKRAGALRGDRVIATTMSNMGLEAALRQEGIAMSRAPVGDKYVLEQMRASGATLGGEQSGHIIFRDGEATTGDGLLTALRVMREIVTSRKSLGELSSDLKVFPQTIVNIPVRQKKPFSEVPEVNAVIKEAERELGSEGRLVVRYSGTEPLARVMVEAASEGQMRTVAERVAAAIRDALGA
jgi:phosphoglucosamine mutase